MSEIYPIAVPKWGIEMVEGTVSNWYKQVGDTVVKGDEVLEMESDKIVNVWESPTAGVLRRQLVNEGDARPVGDLLGVIAAKDVDDAAIDAFIADFHNAEQQAAPAAVVVTANTLATAASGQRRTNPVVQRLASALSVNLDKVAGTGRNGRITQDDVRSAAQANTSDDTHAVARADADIIPLTPTRKTIARRLTEAKQSIPHFYLTTDYELDGLLAYRQQLNESSDAPVSINDLLIWCVARALMTEPRVNVNLVGDNIHQFKCAHVSIAIATDDGLYPVTLRNADSMSLAQISSAIATLTDKVKTGKLTREDISGGSFTVSNLGMFGVHRFTAIINPPMGAILALGKGTPQVVVKDAAPVVATVISATLSCDHRVIDGAVGAQFLAVLGAEIARL